MFPDWYSEFWCPDRMREVDPWGCGFGLGLGAIVLGILAALTLIAVVMAVTWVWCVLTDYSPKRK